MLGGAVSSDLGPSELPVDGLDGTFSAYLIPATGLASKRGDEEALSIMTAATAVSASFSDPPITLVGDATRALVEVTLHGAAGGEDVAQRVAGIIDEVASTDGYHVHVVRLDD